MSKAVVGLGFVVIAASAAIFYAQQQANRTLRREIADLRIEVRDAVTTVRAKAADVRSSATPASSSVAAGERRNSDDLASLRDELVALRKSTQELTQFAQAAQAANALKSLSGTENTIPNKLISADALRNVGKGTPEATAQTLLWAAVGGDVDTLSGTLAFTPTARQKADAWFAGLSENTRQMYGSPEKVLALMIAKDAASLTGMQVLAQKEVTPDDVGVRIRFASAEGKTKDDNVVMHRSADGWRMLLPDSAVEKFARQLSGPK